MENIITVRDLGLVYQTEAGEITAVDNISFTVNEGDFLGIVGPSGCGKSTLLSAIDGLIPVTRGTVTVKDGKKCGYMLQRDYLFPWRTVYGNIMLGLEIQKSKTKENIARANRLIESYGLSDFKNAYPYELSGGMRQRAALIRTLAVNPDILLLDEAFSALDYQTRLAVSDDIYSIIKKEKKTVLMVTHDISECVSLSDRVLVLSGRPSRVKAKYTLNFGENLTPTEKRQSPLFSEYFDRIWRDLDVRV